MTFCDLLRIALVMRHGMMGVAESDLRIGAAAHLVADLEGADARHVGLPGQHHEIGHQLVVIREHRRDAGGACHLRQVVVALRLRELDAPFDIAHRVQILVDLAAVRSAELAAQPPDILGDGIEDAAVLLPQRQHASSRSVAPASPNRRSKTARGRFSIGSGVVSLRHEIVL